MAEYAFYDFARGWPELVVAVDALEVKFREVGRPVAADMVLRAYGEMRDELLVLARDMSVLGTKILRDMEKKTRVRGDTEGRGGPRMEDHLFVEPTEQQNLLPGSIGVANETELDAKVGWWWTNEEGYSGLVGRRLFGFFEGDGDFAPPSREESRVHPLFVPGSSPVSGGGIIAEPIPARRFIEKSIPLIDRAWKTQFLAIKGRFDVAMARAAVTYR
jgi:hypothetical protein